MDTPGRDESVAARHPASHAGHPDEQQLRRSRSHRAGPARGLQGHETELLCRTDLGRRTPRRHRHLSSSVDWVVLRAASGISNRTISGGSKRRFTEMSHRVGFRVVPGLSERVVYREVFPEGLTLLDQGQLGELGTRHLVARQELRELVVLRLRRAEPDRDPATATRPRPLGTQPRLSVNTPIGVQRSPPSARARHDLLTLSDGPSNEYHRVDPTVLREYDIRGHRRRDAGACRRDRAWPQLRRARDRRGAKKVAVGHDGRPIRRFEAALIEGLTAGGLDVVRIGIGPSPMLDYADSRWTSTAASRSPAATTRPITMASRWSAGPPVIRRGNPRPRPPRRRRRLDGRFGQGQRPRSKTPMSGWSRASTARLQDRLGRGQWRRRPRAREIRQADARRASPTLHRGRRQFSQSPSRSDGRGEFADLNKLVADKHLDSGWHSTVTPTASARSTARAA